MHIQAVAVQELSRELGWHDTTDGEILPFLPRIAVWEINEMIQHGVRVDELPRYLQRNYFPGYVPHFAIIRFDSKWLFDGMRRTVMDHNSARWLSAKWVAAGRPVIPRPEWDLLLKNVGPMTERVVMH